MIHQPSGGAQGQATDIKIVADHILRTKKKLNEILAANTGQPLRGHLSGIQSVTTLSSPGSQRSTVW